MDGLGAALRATVAWVAGNVRSRVADVCKTNFLDRRGKGWWGKHRTEKEEPAGEGLQATGSLREMGNSVQSRGGFWKAPDSPLDGSSGPSLFRLSTRSGTPFSKESNTSPNVNIVWNSVAEVGKAFVWPGVLSPPPVPCSDPVCSEAWPPTPGFPGKVAGKPPVYLQTVSGAG